MSSPKDWATKAVAVARAEKRRKRLVSAGWPVIQYTMLQYTTGHTTWGVVQGRAVSCEPGGARTLDSTQAGASRSAVPGVLVTSPDFTFLSLLPTPGHLPILPGHRKHSCLPVPRLPLGPLTSLGVVTVFTRAPDVPPAGPPIPDIVH